MPGVRACQAGPKAPGYASATVHDELIHLPSWALAREDVLITPSSKAVGSLIGSPCGEDTKGLLRCFGWVANAPRERGGGPWPPQWPARTSAETTGFEPV